jgi:N-methylhydantoinase A
VPARLAAAEAAKTVMSGPASGVMAAAHAGGRAGFPNLITYDMGGTSTDVGLVRDGTPSVSDELELEYAMPVRVPMVDVHTIGAGGGSIARVDEAGLLRVGPGSAGAVPGPVCYGRGGSLPTITDADLALGRLDPARLIATGRAVAPAEVEAALVREVGGPLGLGGDAAAAAAAVLRVAHDRMAGAVRVVSLARGHDPRDYVLFAFGGAGPLHAVALARELGVPTVLVPARPGITNAVGCAVADLRHDFVRAVNLPLERLAPGRLLGVLAEQAEAGRRMLARAGLRLRETVVLRSADMQFRGQTHLLNVPLDPSAPPEPAGLRAAFERAYLDRFGIELPEIGAALVNLRTSVIGRREPVDIALLAAGPGRATRLEDACRGRRRAWFEGAGWSVVPVYERERLPADAMVEGPAIVEQADSATVLEPGSRARQDRLGNLVIDVG